MMTDTLGPTIPDYYVFVNDANVALHHNPMLRSAFCISWGPLYHTVLCVCVAATTDSAGTPIQGETPRAFQTCPNGMWYEPDRMTIQLAWLHWIVDRPKNVVVIQLFGWLLQPNIPKVSMTLRPFETIPLKMTISCVLYWLIIIDVLISIMRPYWNRWQQDSCSKWFVLVITTHHQLCVNFKIALGGSRDDPWSTQWWNPGGATPQKFMDR